MSEDVKPTRKNLMAIEDRIELSEQGHDTLEKKRDGLIMEFMDIFDQAQDVRSDLDGNYERAQHSIDMARAAAAPRTATSPSIARAMSRERWARA